VFCCVGAVLILGCFLVIPVTLHDVVTNGRTLGQGVNVLLVLNWVDLLIFLIGLLLGLQILVAVRKQMRTNVAIAEALGLVALTGLAS